MRATSIRKGKILKHEGALYEVTKVDHITPGKGNAIMQVGVRNLETGKSMKFRFRSAENVETVHFEAKPHQFMYQEGGIFYFMDLEDYHTIEIPEDFIGEHQQFLLENMEIGIAFHDGRPIHVEMPRVVQLKVTYAEPWVKGDSVSNNTKPVTVETGLELKVPMFVNEGDVLKIDTESGEYLERV